MEQQPSRKHPASPVYEVKWPDACACGHSGYQHHLVFHGTHFGPDYFCKGNIARCRCVEYRAAVRA